ncbi:MAG: FAD-dependent oxidoreductase [Chlorobium sp.]|uniref:FAD-dependent oxidoreductase n=1 Tax=Chlorobium sp. TaxID=1095 RepID=UPI0025BAFF7C|nr:FAD-dependent oxidoreductase [Chlorobium sp.]MCF8216910.1 FAD-dependent oxidoreductase [Chlorobium sp.]MCF8271724.1 FAD-dependent oxidoreductase [Chlorobium sp.]MCF8288112.1 FAD-dependent oxidoreductase [Chlorobium sp.]MCF8291703.1 FAD-dependent oxidoreductase [Chlorobium sp.]MCF8385810.1 FAD-dependent oxidoreductase [Chlorobium sp.]
MSSDKKTVLILGGGLAGLTAAKRLTDRGFQVRVLEKRDIYGGKVSAWKDEEGDWIESGTHCFFGAYDVLYELMKEIKTYHAVLWKEHQLTYTLEGGKRFTFNTWDLPSPLHLLPAIIRNGYFSFGEMASFSRSLIPLALKQDAYPPTQDHLTFAEWAEQKRFGSRLMEKMFRPMALALKFIPPEEISAKIILDVTETFYRIPGSSCMGFLKGSPQEYMHQPLLDYSASRGVVFRNRTAVDELLFDGSEIKGVQLRNGEILTADYYLSALPIHTLNKVLPASLKSRDRFFGGLSNLEGVPVISVQIWYDREIVRDDNVLFSPDGIIPVYADLARTTPEYRTLRGEPFEGKTRFEFCVAPARELMRLSREEIIHQVDLCVRSCYPLQTKGAAILKSTLVKIPHSVYAPLPNMEQYRPSQQTPVPNLFLAGGFSRQLYYDSMGGAVMSANLAAEGVLKAEGIE